MAVDRIRDLVSVSPRPSVVSLDQLEAGDPEWITASFFLTEQIQAHLEVLERVLDAGTGAGIFVVGHYGSGKSHFLAYVVQQLRSGRLSQGPRAPRGAVVSLLNYPAEVALETVVREALGLEGETADRRHAWSELDDRDSAGTVLIVDELSEFLRSKGDRGAFNEDIRFLQFMGEWAQAHRFWILAAMQEQIEHTGELESALYRKIKDRFPIRLMFTVQHVRGLLSDSILEKKAGYDEAVAELAGDVRRALPEAPIDLQALQELYPLHPATLELLEEVRDLFSQTRGVVDFTLTRLLGDSARGVEAFLDRPWGELLTPEAIVDHFADLFELQPEFLPLAQTFLPYYRRHVTDLFDSEAQRELAWRLLKLLMLVHISPQRDGLTAEQAAAWLLFRATSISPSRNVQILARLLGRLASEGRYVKERNGLYWLDLADDSSERLAALVERMIGDLEGESEDAVWDTLLAALGEHHFNPFTLPRDRWQEHVVRWHFHERRYGVYFGNGDPERRTGAALVIRLPWGEAKPASGMVTLVPARLHLGRDLLDLAAHLRLVDRPGAESLKGLITNRVEQRRELFARQVRSSYLELELYGPEGGKETPRRISPSTQLKAWLHEYALWRLRRTYPSFERFAPGHGPLPKAAYVNLMRVAREHDLGDYEADEYVKLIREAYLVPMGLMVREGWYYTNIARLDEHDLVQLVMPLVENRPSLKVVYEHLAEPVYGLVPDQIHLLLIFLLLQGEIDITKGGRSYRDLNPTLPLPIHYDRIEYGKGLSVEQLRALEQLCAATRVRHPKQWTVTAQRETVKRLRRVGEKHRQRLHPLLVKLKNTDRDCALVATLIKHLESWEALAAGENELQGFERLLFAIDSPERFASELKELAELPERLERVLGEVKRLAHLLADPCVRSWPDPVVRTRVEAVPGRPGIDNLSALEEWLQEARAAYESYVVSYRQQHDVWWGELAQHPLWSWAPPEVAKSRHLGLENELHKLAELGERLRSSRCRGLGDLDFSGRCTCGFDGSSAPAAALLGAGDELQNRIDGVVLAFFGRSSVKERVREWKEQGVELTQGMLDYLEGTRAVPEIRDVERFDRHMAGLEVVREVAGETILEVLGSGVWEIPDLLAAIEREVGRYEGKRLRFVCARSEGIPPALSVWCVEQSLRSAVPLPREVPAKDVDVRPEWVSAQALALLESLGLGEIVEDRVLVWVLDGTVGVGADREVSPLVGAVLEVLAPATITEPERLARASRIVYAAGPRLARLAGHRWRERIEALESSPLSPAPPDLVEVLQKHLEWQWLMVDCLGLPLLSKTLPVVDEVLRDWRRDRVLYATVSATTTTDGCFRQLAEAGVEHPMEKVNAVDRVLHQRRAPFADVERLVAAELEVALRGVVRRLDRRRPLLLFADHGFRLDVGSGDLVHGGASTLERTVPVIELTPRMG